MTEENRSHMVAVTEPMLRDAFAKLAQAVGDMTDREVNATLRTKKHGLRNIRARGVLT